MKKYWVPLLCWFLLFSPSPGAAEKKTFLKEYTYQASEVDSKVSSRSIALEQVKRLLLEELGTYLESHTEVVNFQLKKDQITALTAGNDPLALADYTKAIEADPRYASAYVNRAAVYARRGNYQQVLDDSNKAIELDPRNALGYINRALAYNKLRNYQRAREDGTRAIELAPKNALGYVHRAEAYSNLGDQERAVSDRKTAARMGHAGAQSFLRSKGIQW